MTNNTTTQIKNFDIENGLGKISFSPELISNIIKKVLHSFKDYEYVSHTIETVHSNYYEVSIHLKTPNPNLNFKEIDRLQKEMLLVMKQSLSLTCVVVLNIDNGK
ncbi:MAG: hypothetical protein MJ200_00745 [Mycoplasmoidaceae bacterium]|nr:hypothetical protein [Mycoplasmoidaceae bacterium]